MKSEHLQKGGINLADKAKRLLRCGRSDAACMAWFYAELRFMAGVATQLGMRIQIITVRRRFFDQRRKKRGAISAEKKSERRKTQSKKCSVRKF